MDINDFLSSGSEVPPLPLYVPEVNPPSIRDLNAVDFNKHFFNVDMSCQDPCPVCGGHNMTVGDYIYLGSCCKCYEDECYEEYAS